MISRTLLGVLSATLALAVAAPLHAAPVASAELATVSTATYHIERHGPQVLVKDANGKTLVTCRAATPTLQGIFVKNTPNGAASAGKEAPAQLRFMLEDQNGLRLWSTLVPVIYPFSVGVSYSSNINGSEIAVTHQAEDTSASDQPETSRLLIVMGQDGRPVSMSDGIKTMNFAIGPTGISLADPSGKVLMKEQATSKNGIVFTTPDGVGHLQARDNGAAIEFNGVKGSTTVDKNGVSTLDWNGTKIVVKKVVKDGKTYSSFPWNGHKVLIENSCIWSVTSDGDLTVNAPSVAETTASK